MGTFYLFAGMSAVSFVFVWFLLPETKGKTLAQIHQMLLDRAARKGLIHRNAAGRHKGRLDVALKK